MYCTICKQMSQNILFSVLCKKMFKKNQTTDHYDNSTNGTNTCSLFYTENKNMFASARFNKGLALGLISQRFLKLN